jgi:hypothetical protein
MEYQAAITVRQWLKANEYNDIANMIDEIINQWKKAGKRTRRNWWEILAGSKNGMARSIEGQTFPVLKTAQIRQGLPITDNAIFNSENEVAPPIRSNTRWKERHAEDKLTPSYYED